MVAARQNPFRTSCARAFAWAEDDEWIRAYKRDFFGLQSRHNDFEHSLTAKGGSVRSSMSIVAIYPRLSSSFFAHQPYHVDPSNPLPMRSIPHGRIRGDATAGLCAVAAVFAYSHQRLQRPRRWHHPSSRAQARSGRAKSANDAMGKGVGADIWICARARRFLRDLRRPIVGSEDVTMDGTGKWLVTDSVLRHSDRKCQRVGCPRKSDRQARRYDGLIDLRRP
jgi:hypothetical protein